MRLIPTPQAPAFISRSEPLGTDYAVYVHAPSPSHGQGPWPSAIFLDGDYTFEPAVRAYRSLRESGAVPEAAIVGIGYARPFGHPENRRGRDYTPTSAPEEPASGGADNFLAHLTDSLWPELAGRFSLDRESTVLAGHSLSGLLVLHAVFKANPFFRLALVGAPSIWWNDRSFLAFLKSFRDRQPTVACRLVLGIGALETPSMIEDMALLEAQLAERPFEGLALTSLTFPKRNHYDVVPDLFSSGLRTLLSPPVD